MQSKYEIIALMIIPFVVLACAWYWSQYHSRMKKNKRLLLFKKINLNINNDFKEIFYQNKKYKIIMNYNVSRFLAFIFYFLCNLFLLIVLCYKLSKKYLEPTTTVLVLIYLIPILIFLIFALVVLLYCKKDFVKIKKSLSKDLETIKLYFNELKISENKSTYDFEIVNDKDIWFNKRVVIIKKRIINKINKLKFQKVDDNYIVLYIAILLSKRFIEEINIRNISIYKNKKIINSDFNYELFFLKYILSKVNEYRS